jgi:hypothetical protein
MALNVNNQEADALTRRFARMAGITDAIVIAIRGRSPGGGKRKRPGNRQGSPQPMTGRPARANVNHAP